MLPKIHGVLYYMYFIVFISLGILGLLTLSIYNIFFSEFPLLNSVGHLAVSVIGSCVWLLIYNVRIKIARGALSGISESMGERELIDGCI